MNSINQTTPINDTYTLFESHIRKGFKLLNIKPHSIEARIRHYNLPKITETLEKLELVVEFPGATCIIDFGHSTLYTDLFFSGAEFHRLDQRTLFLKDYLANRKDQRKESLRFSDTQFTLEEGINRIVEVLVALFNDELQPLLAGLTWITAPVDWEGYK